MVRVIAVACDVHDLCDSDEGIIDIPFVTTSTATLTPAPISTSTITPSATLIPTLMLFAPTSAVPVTLPEIAPEPAQPARSLPLWQILGLLGLFLAIASASVTDSRPPALDRLRERITLILNQQKALSDDKNNPNERG